LFPAYSERQFGLDGSTLAPRANILPLSPPLVLTPWRIFPVRRDSPLRVRELRALWILLSFRGFM
jgi:hypothetical protein